jgi:alanine racemase
MDVCSITLTNADSVAAGDHVVLGLNRDISADGVAGDIEVVGCDFQYTTT